MPPGVLVERRRRRPVGLAKALKRDLWLNLVIFHFPIIFLNGYGASETQCGVRPNKYLVMHGYKLLAFFLSIHPIALILPPTQT